MRALAAIVFFTAAGVSAEGIGTPVEVSCARPASFARAFQVQGTAGIFAAGYNSAKRPVVARVDRGLRWCKEFGANGQTAGLLLHGGALYAAISTPAQAGPLEALTKQGWLRAAGRGGAAIGLILKMNVATGEVERGTFVTASADDGSSAFVQFKSWVSDGENLRLTTLTGWQPRMRNRVPMTCTGKPPFVTTMIIRPDLASVVDAKAERCVCCE